MKTIDTSDWVVVNNIIYHIYSNNDCSNMRQDFLEEMKMVMDFDSADFYIMAADDSNHLTEPVMFNCDDDFSEVYERVDREKKSLFSGKSLVFRGTDMIPDDKRRSGEMYVKVCKPNNWNYSLHMILCRNKELLGMISFYRTIGKSNFDYDDIFMLDILKNHLALSLYRFRENIDITHEKLTVTEASEKYSLTKQEHMILKLLMDGRDNGFVCTELNISVNTLKKHILNIYRKLNIRNRVQMFKMIKEKE